VPHFRQFLTICAATLLVLTVGAAVKTNAYRIILLGDTHFDADIYHKELVEKNESLAKSRQPEFARNKAFWQERAARIFAAARTKVTPDTAFVLQLGDLFQGDCGTAEAHERMLTDALDYFKKAFPGLPFLTVVGNHDYRSPGGKKVYKRVMTPRMKQEIGAIPGNAGTTVSGTTFYFRHGPDLFVFINFESPDDAVIGKAFASHADARHKFVVSHGPVIPLDKGKRPDWIPYGRNAERRAWMRDLFLKHNVIVLTGHAHVISYLRYATEAGTIVQFMANTIWDNATPETPKVIGRTVAGYGSVVAKTKIEANIKLLAEYKPGLKEYYHARGAGYCTLDISPGGVEATYYHRDATTPCKTFKLR